MIDTVPSFRSPLYDDGRQKKLSASFYWAVLFAVLLHLALLYYFFNQSFSLAPVEAVPEQRPTIVEFYKEPPPTPPKPETAPQTPIVLHTPAAPVPTTVDTIPVDPKPLTPVVSSEPAKPPVLTEATGGASTSSASAAPVVKVTWTRFPDANALGQYYPESAANAEIEGRALVECTVLDKAGRVSCVAISESPGNYGFGKATVRMVQEKGRVDTTQGDITVGSKLRATIQWTLGG